MVEKSRKSRRKLKKNRNSRKSRKHINRNSRRKLKKNGRSRGKLKKNRKKTLNRGVTRNGGADLSTTTDFSTTGEEIVCVSWNVSHDSWGRDWEEEVREKGDMLFKELIHLIKEKKIIILAFQEIAVRAARAWVDFFLEKVNGVDEEYSIIDHKGCGSGHAGNGFTLLTLVLSPRNVENRMIAERSEAKCFTSGWYSSGSTLYSSKGFLITELELNTKTLVVINTHLPFNDISLMKSAYDSINGVIQDPITYPVLLLGDLNGRCILSSEHYKKNVDLCNGTESEKCTVFDYLTNLTFEETYAQNLLDSGVMPYQKAPDNLTTTHRIDYKDLPKKNFCRLRQGTRDGVNLNRREDECGVDVDLCEWSRGRCRKSYKFFENPITNMKQGTGLGGTRGEILRTLRYTDVTGLIWKKNDGWDEGEITFWPTYKRDPDTGRFKLEKGREGRLPGYADRIMVNNSKSPEGGAFLQIIAGTYKSLPVTGSDHLPVECEFNLSLK